MKIIFTLCAASLLLAFAKASPASVSRETDIQASVEKLLEQAVDVVIQEKDEEEMVSKIQGLLSAEQLSDEAETEGFFGKIWKGAKKIAKKSFKFGKKLYNMYNKLKDCAEVEDMPQEIENAIIERIFMVHGTSETDKEEQMAAELQDFLTTADAQGKKFKRIWKKAKKLVKKSFKLGRKAYDIYNKVQNGGSCVQASDISDELEDAMAEAFFKQEEEQLKMLAIEELLQE